MTVFVRSETGLSGGGLFLEEEQDLLDAVAKRVGRIIERHWTEEALRESETRYRNLVENLGEIVFSTDTQGKLTYVSPNIQDITGFSQEEILGRPFASFVHPEDRPDRSVRFQEILKGGSRASEFRLVTCDGEERWVRTSARPLVEKGRVAGIQGLLMDITNERMTQKKREEREKLQGVIETAGAVCHELNQPLQAVLGYVELLQSELQTAPPNVLGYAKRVQELVRRMGHITDRLLTISRYRTRPYVGDMQIIDIDRTADRKEKEKGMK